MAAPAYLGATLLLRRLNDSGSGWFQEREWRASDVQTIAREAEEAGFDAIFATEVNNDVMATAPLSATVGTCASP